MKRFDLIVDLASNVAWSIFAHLLNRGSLIVASIILARNLETKDFAAYSYFYLTVSMLAAYATMGLGVTASRFFAESACVDEDRMPPVGMLWAFSIMAGLLCSFIIFCLPDTWLDGGLGIPNWVFSLGVFSMSFGVVPSGGTLGLERYAEATLTMAVSATILIIGAIITGISNSTLGAMLVFIAASLLTAIGNSIVVVRKIGGVERLLKRARFDKADFRVIVSFAGPMIGVTILAASGSWLVGRIILGGPSGEESFALYAIGLQWFSLTLFLPGIVSRVTLPKMVKAQVKVSWLPSRGYQRLTRQCALLALYTALLVSITGVIFSPLLLKLYGENFQSHYWFLVAFILAAIPSAPANTIGNAIVAANGQKEWLGMTLIWFIFLLIVTKTFLSYGVWSGVFAHTVASLMLIAMAFITARNKGLL